MLDFMNITRALSDENRVRILMALRKRAFCVCQITALLDLSPSTTSKHLSVLKQARLIEGKKQGKWVYYRLANPDKRTAMVREVLEWTQRHLENSDAILLDNRIIERILSDEERLFGICPGEPHDEFHSLEVHSMAIIREEESRSGDGDEETC